MALIEIAEKGVEEGEEFRLDIGDSWFDLQRFDSEFYRQIEKKHTTKKAVNADMLDHMIKGWGKIKSPVTGKDVPCERKYKLKLPGSVKIQITEACDSESITTEKNGIDELERYIEFTSDYPEVNCKRCEEIEEVDGIEPDCENCDLPVLSHENSKVIELYQTINTQFVYDFNALPLVFEIYGTQCTRGEAKEVLKKLIMIHSALEERRKEETGKED